MGSSHPPNEEGLLANQLIKLGYTLDASESGDGGYMFRKSGSNEQRLEVSLDVGSSSYPSLSVDFAWYRGSSHCIIPFPVSDTTVGMLQYPIRSAEELKLISENIGKMVEYLEQTAVVELNRHLNNAD